MYKFIANKLTHEQPTETVQLFPFFFLTPQVTSARWCFFTIKYNGIHCLTSCHLSVSMLPRPPSPKFNWICSKQWLTPPARDQFSGPRKLKKQQICITIWMQQGVGPEKCCKQAGFWSRGNNLHFTGMTQHDLFPLISERRPTLKSMSRSV